MIMKLKRPYGARSLEPWERLLAAVTAALAVAMVALAVVGQASAGALGALPEDGPFLRQPTAAISHAEAGPDPSPLSGGR